MKKILFVANVAKEHILKFHLPSINEFSENGYIVDVACAGDDFIPGCRNQYKMPWKRSPFSLKTFKGIRELKKIIDREKYDVVYCHTPVGGLAARLASMKTRKSGTKVVYFAHGFHFYKGASLLNWCLYYPVEKMLSRVTDMIFTINKEDYELALSKMSKKSKVMLTPGVGFNTARLKTDDCTGDRNAVRDEFGISDSSVVLIYVAELIKNKNQGMLIDAVKVLRERGVDVYLMLVGPDHYGSHFQNKASECGLSDRVIFTGWRSDIGRLMRGADICVASSIREGFGINLVEAMYCGLPVIATRNRGHVTVITDGENGFLVDVDDYQGMANRVEQVLGNDQLRERLSNVEVSCYDSIHVAKELYRILVENCNDGEE